VTARAAAALVALLSAGCFVGSLQPVYTDDTIVFDEALLGRWEIRDSEVSVDLARGQWRSYQVAYTDRFGTTRFTGHLTKIGPAQFFNVRPEDGLERPAFLVATNGFMQIEIVAAGVRVREPDYAALLERAGAGAAGISAAVDLKKNVLLTAPSPRVRAWIEASLKDDALWADWKTFTRSLP
jgi:hypothetical protein